MNEDKRSQLMSSRKKDEPSIMMSWERAIRLTVRLNRSQGMRSYVAVAWRRRDGGYAWTAVRKNSPMHLDRSRLHGGRS